MKFWQCLRLKAQGCDILFSIHTTFLLNSVLSEPHFEQELSRELVKCDDSWAAFPEILVRYVLGCSGSWKELLMSLPDDSSTVDLAPRCWELLFLKSWQSELSRWFCATSVGKHASYEIIFKAFVDGYRILSEKYTMCYSALNNCTKNPTSLWKKTCKSPYIAFNYI